MAHAFDEPFPSGPGDVGPEGSDELRLLRSIRRARDAARYAGRNSGRIEPLDDIELDAPIDLDAPSVGEGDGASSDAATLPRIEGYRLLGEVGSGGQATVYRAIQQATGRIVAIKVIADGIYATSRGRARFEREARILAALDHPHIVGILDRGRTSEGAFFIAMPFVEGRGLEEHVEAVLRDDVTRVLPLMIAVVEAVAEAHRRGIVHRDLKPSNIRVDGRGEPRVLDFGLARLLETGEADAPTTTAVPIEITRTGQIMGSLPWLSPEQAAGAASMLDFRSDVYALGLLLYFALAGHLPYPTNASVGEVLDNIRNTIPRPPSEVAPTRGISPQLDAIVLKALSKAAPDRYPSAVELAADLGDYVNGRRTRVRPRTPMRPLLALVGTGLLCAFVVSGILTHSRWLTSKASKTTAPTKLLPPAETAVRAVPRPGPSMVAFTDSAGLAFVRIPRGEFWMGSPASEAQREDRERPHRALISRDFWMSESEVTERQYTRVMGQQPWDPQFDDSDLPAHEVRWDDAVAFCQKRSKVEGCTYRLPTEAEWEHACRAGSSDPFGGSGRLLEMGWCAENSGGVVHPVKRLAANAWGLYDMHGNVAEWCADYFADYPQTDEPVVDPTGPRIGIHRVLRGGSFHDTWDLCRSAKRVARDPAVGGQGIGFRVVREAEQQLPRGPDK